MYNGRYTSLTYGQMEFLLTEMGYRKYPSTDPDLNIWKNQECDTRQILPSSRQNQPVPTMEFMAIRKISIERGVIEPEEFEALLEKARLLNAEPAHTQDAA